MLARIHPPCCLGRSAQPIRAGARETLALRVAGYERREGSRSSHCATGRAQAAGYNGVVLSPNLTPDKAKELREAAQRHGLDIVAIVMGNSRDRNYMEGLPTKDALFVVRGGVAIHQPDQ